MRRVESFYTTAQVDMMLGDQTLHRLWYTARYNSAIDVSETLEVPKHVSDYLRAVKACSIL